jgi:uncharacterized protein involved in oxidation of intracellular sulfur
VAENATRAARVVSEKRQALGKAPDGYYNIERMLKRVLAGKGQVLLCATCMDARGLTDAEVMPGAKRSSMDELATASAHR